MANFLDNVPPLIGEPSWHETSGRRVPCAFYRYRDRPEIAGVGQAAREAGALPPATERDGRMVYYSLSDKERDEKEFVMLMLHNLVEGKDPREPAPAIAGLGPYAPDVPADRMTELEALVLPAFEAEIARALEAAEA